MFRRLFRTPGPFVYGTLTVGAVLDAEGAKIETFAETLFGVALAMVLVWFAHTYAQLTTERSLKQLNLTPRLLLDTMEHELPILLGAAFPLIVVGIWWATGDTLDHALGAGIWASAAMLVVINIIAGIQAQLSGIQLIIQTIFGIVLGVGIIVLKLIFH